MAIFKKPYLKKISKFLVPKLIWLISNVIYATCKHNFYLRKSGIEGNFIGIFWHGEILMQPYLYRKILELRGQKKPKVTITISQHSDGDISSELYKMYGFDFVRGSTSRGGLKILIECIKRLKDGWDVAITPDGPRGPLHSMSDGPVAMSQKSGVKVVGFRVLPTKFWQLNTWDKLAIPMPFSTINYYMLEPMYASGIEFQEAKRILREAMISEIELDSSFDTILST